MKICRECRQNKPMSDYYQHPAMADGHLNKCKTCVLARTHRWRVANIERIREIDRRRGLLPVRKAAVKARAPRYKQKRAKAMEQYNAANPERRKAHIIVNNAIRSGKLKVKPCERCGFAFGVQAHHEDHNKPLDVTWLCTPCHGERHREINAERRAARKSA